MKSLLKTKNINYNRRNNKRIDRLKAEKSIISEKNKKTTILVLIINPSKFIDPITSYRLNTDLIILDKVRYNLNNDLIGTLSSLSDYKKILSVFFDNNLNILSIPLENYNYNFGSPELLISRLESLNDNNAFLFANHIDIFLKICDKMGTQCKYTSNKPQEINRYNDFIKQKTEKIKKYNEENKLFVTFDFKMDNVLKMLQINQVNLSIGLIKTIFNSENEAYFTLSRRFPDYYTIEIDRFYELYTEMLKKFFGQSQEMLEVYLINKDNIKIKSFMELETDTYLEDNYIETYLITSHIIKNNFDNEQNILSNLNKNNNLFQNFNELRNNDYIEETQKFISEFYEN